MLLFGLTVGAVVAEAESFPLHGSLSLLVPMHVVPFHVLSLLSSFWVVAAGAGAEFL